MSVTAKVNERLAALTAAGTSVWLDQIRRSLIECGELERLVKEESLRGVTSNPTIFEKAILGSTDYDAELTAMAREGIATQEIFDRIAVKDVQLAADVLRSVWEESGHADGFVSLEVAPHLARDTQGTIEQARDYWGRVDRPNLMIKIPGTEEGVPAIKQAISDAINVNVTLLFGVEEYARVAEAFITGLESRHADGASLDVHSVASFFVSRVDTEVDKRLLDMGKEELAGIAALANARAAYQRFTEIFAGERWGKLAQAGASVQRPLWASTGVKNPHYSETMYVDGLVAPHTVNTMPMATLNAVAEKGEVVGPTADQDPTEDLRRLAEAGIDMDDVTDKLLRAGIASFEGSMEGLLAGVEDKRKAIVTGRPPTIASSIPDELEPAIARKAQQAVTERVARRVWRKDESLWGGPDKPEIGNRLGWLTIVEQMLEHVGDLQQFVEDVKADGFEDVVLLGMGGSSLGPEVIRRSFGAIEGGLRLHVLDSTDPAAVLKPEREIDPAKTLFLVSSKSGATIETISHFRHFHARTVEAVGEADAGSRFVAITDPGSPLIAIAEKHGFRRVFENSPDIGGRYSVLSYFGLVPAALMGVAVDALLQRAQIAEQNCASLEESYSNSGLWLGVLMGALAQEGRNKVTFVVSKPIVSFGLWIEQLIAESTGKEGKGILPVDDEPLGGPESYGEDRVFAYLRNAEEPDEELDAKVEALGKAGQPTVTLSVHGALDLGRIFFFAEFATAVAGWALGINPFDQPNVQEAKDNTTKVLEDYTKEGKLPDLPEADDDALRELLGRAEPPRYVAIMGWLKPASAVDEAVARLRASIRYRTKATTTFGYGPRFLHSTGQLHKGGPSTGLFLQLVHDPGEDVDIPGAGYGFATLEEAQAAGDLLTLRDHGLPAERVRLEGDPVQAIDALRERVERLLG